MGLARFYRLYAYLFAKPFFYRFNRFLHQLSLRGMGVLNWESEHLQGEIAVMKRHLANAPKGAVVLDVGANVGKYSDAVRAIAPQVQLHSFEPSRRAFLALQDRMRDTGAICVQSAVGSSDGTATLFDYEGGDGSGHATLQGNVIERVHGAKSQSFEVEILRLDTYVERLALPSIYWLKIDVEGRELDVLQGLASCIERGFDVRFIQIEFNEMNVMSGTSLEKICNVLHGYRVYRIMPGGRLLDLTDERVVLREIYAFQNLLFSRTALT